MLCIKGKYALLKLLLLQVKQINFGKNTEEIMLIYIGLPIYKTAKETCGEASSGNAHLEKKRRKLLKWPTVVIIKTVLVQKNLKNWGSALLLYLKLAY